MATIDHSAWHRLCDITADRTSKAPAPQEAFSLAMEDHMAKLEPEQRQQAMKVAQVWGYRAPGERAAALA